MIIKRPKAELMRNTCLRVVVIILICIIDFGSYFTDDLPEFLEKTIKQVLGYQEI